MLLSKSLVMAMKSYDISGVKVLCDGSIREKAAKTFVDKFRSKWNNALDLVEEECGNCTTKEKKAFPACDSADRIWLFRQGSRVGY